MSFKRFFILLATLYFFAFYLAPLFIIASRNTTVFYANVRYTPTVDSLMFAFGMGALFYATFLLGCLLLFRRSTEVSIPSKKSYSQRLAIFAIMFAIFYVVYGIYFADAEGAYAVRQRIEQGSRLNFFIAIALGNLGILLAIKLDQYRMKLPSTSLIIIMLISGLMSGSGRYSLIVLIAMLVAANLKLRIRFYYFFPLAIIGLAALPIVIHMKEVIFVIGTGGSVFDIEFSRFYESEAIADKYLANFGHPLFSLLFVDQTLQETGYRFFYDYAQGFLFFFRAFGIDFGDSLTYYNTFTLFGYKISMIPPGYIAFGFIQLHFVGVAVAGLTYALIGFICNKARLLIAPTSSQAKVFFCVTAANTFYHGEMRLIVMNVLLGIFIMVLMNLTLFSVRFKTARHSPA